MICGSLILLVITVRYTPSSDVWEHLSGNQSINIPSDYSVSYPGGLADHAMVAWNDFIYVFGGANESESSN